MGCLTKGKGTYYCCAVVPSLLSCPFVLRLGAFTIGQANKGIVVVLTFDDTLVSLLFARSLVSDPKGTTQR